MNSTTRILGVDIRNVTKAQAIAMMDGWIRARDHRPRQVFIVNAHTLNLAYTDAGYRNVLNAGDAVFGDGTGVRLAARLKGVRMVDNLVGTDLVPEFIEATLPQAYSYFLLGGTQETAAKAAGCLEKLFAGIRIAGYHGGYINSEQSRGVVRTINDSGADVLLVAMGNPLQERWIYDHREQLKVPVSIGVGGLFDHWAGNLKRAPLWVRRFGVEWLQILAQQPGRKWRRYVLGNPAFLYRALRG